MTGKNYYVNPVIRIKNVFKKYIKIHELVTVTQHVDKLLWRICDNRRNRYFDISIYGFKKK